MGCSSNNYGVQTNEDFFTKSFYESSKERRKKEKNENKKDNASNINQIETDYFNNENSNKCKSYFDNLINNEIPKMDFGNLAEEKEIIKDIENREGIFKDNEESNNNKYEEEKKIFENEENKTNKNEENNSNNTQNYLKKQTRKKTKFFTKKNNNDNNETKKDETNESNISNINNIKSKENLSNNSNKKKEFSQIYKFSNNIKFKFNSPFPKPLEKQMIDFSPNPSKLIITIIGKEYSGKTSLFSKYIHSKLPKNYESTHEINENSDMNFNYNEKNIKLVIIDTPPIPKSENLNVVQEQINKSHIIIYIFDVTEEDIIFSIDLTFKNFDFIDKQIVCVLANKMDTPNEYTDDNVDIVENFCKEKNFDFIPISVMKFKIKEIVELFEEIIMDYFKKYK